MDLFKLLTPISYWLLILMWSFILVFYLRRLFTKKLKNKFFGTLILILAIDALRTLFESIYFGAWYTSVAGMIPSSIHAYLIRPENVFIPKALNVVAATLVILIVLKHWIPQEEKEREERISYTQRLEKEIADRKKAEKEREAVIIELKEALSNVKLLSGLIPICAYCKKVRDDKGYWNQVETYIENHSDASFSHGYCPECLGKLYGNQKWYIKNKEKLDGKD
ncbi:hypothetical protein KAR48_15210 [bacterium]|nr:hypothetical protein [bacterium]